MSDQPTDHATAAALEFGLFDWIDVAPGVPPAEEYDGRLRLLAEADKGGFAVYHLAEHHGTPLGLAPSQVPIRPRYGSAPSGSRPTASAPQLCRRQRAADAHPPGSPRPMS